MTGEPSIILLVEDNPDHAELVMRNMEGFNAAIRIIHVENGQEALDYLYGNGEYADRKRYPLPHLMLLDLRLPKVDGLQVLKEVKCSAILRAIRVVILTTSDAERILAMACEYHADSYLTKPIDLNDFSTLLVCLGGLLTGPEQTAPLNNA